MAQHGIVLNPIIEARRQLVAASNDPRTKIMNFSGVLIALSDALGELQRRQDSTQMQLDKGWLAHPAECECKLCALTRMVQIGKDAAR